MKGMCFRAPPASLLVLVPGAQGLRKINCQLIVSEKKTIELIVAAPKTKINCKIKIIYNYLN